MKEVLLGGNRASMSFKHRVRLEGVNETDTFSDLVGRLLRWHS